MGEATSSDEEDIFDKPYELEDEEEDIYLDPINVYEDLPQYDYVVFRFSLNSL